MGYTKKPCPGCGKVYGNRAADEVCWQCRRKIDGFDAMSVETEELRRRVEGAGRATEPVNVASPWFNFPRGGAGWVETPLALRQAVTALVVELAKPLSTGKAGNGRHLPRLHVFDHSETLRGACFVPVEMTDTAVEALRTFDRLMGEALLAAEARGAEKGRSLLHQLASGDVTIHEFNESSVNRR